MDVDDLTPLMKTIVDTIRPKAEDMPDAVREGGRQKHARKPCSAQVCGGRCGIPF